MSDEVYWTLELDVVSGQENPFRALAAEMVEAIRAKELGTLQYEWATNSEGTRCVIRERYADSAAVMTHLGTFGERFADRFFQVLKPTGFLVYGSPSAEVRQALAGLGPVYMEPVAGFSR